MFRACRILISLAIVGLLVPLLLAEERVTPKAAKGGTPQGEPWADVPEGFKNLKIPEWHVPTDLKKWQKEDRAKVRETVLRCLGEMPARPDPGKVKVVSKQEFDDYTLEKIEFHNGVDMVVQGIILIPKKRKGRAPAIIALHGHGGTKETVCSDEKSQECVGPMLAKRGYVVAAIDSYFSGERLGKGPAGAREKERKQEQLSLYKLNLWLGRTLWGMMLRDEQCLLDYLATRPEVDKEKIGATGMSMGCTRSWWLAALDDRVKAVVGVVCFTRYTELIAHGGLRAHAIYYFVPGILAHFDTEAIYSLVAPRPMLMLSGDQDLGSPTDGVVTLEKKLAQVWKLYGKPENFRSVVYKNTGHEYLPEMKDEMLKWFEKHLPVAK